MRAWARAALRESEAARGGAAASSSGAGPPLVYTVDASRLPADLASRFTQLSRDAGTESFLSTHCDPSFPSFLKSVSAPLLRMFLSVTDTNGLLGRGQMHVLSAEQSRLLLSGCATAHPARPRPTQRRLLDVGAGDGTVTNNLAPMFERVTTTELSPQMAARLRGRGFECFETTDLSHAALGLRAPHTEAAAAAAGAATDGAGEDDGFDVVSCLNVLDRCDKPLTLLRDLRALLRPSSSTPPADRVPGAAASGAPPDAPAAGAGSSADGLSVVLLAVVLPWSAFVEDGTRQRTPTEMLPMGSARCCDRPTFEHAVSTLVERVLRPAGLDVIRWSRVPYLSAGDMSSPYYVLDDAVFVLQSAPHTRWPVAEAKSRRRSSFAAAVVAAAAKVTADACAGAGGGGSIGSGSSSGSSSSGSGISSGLCAAAEGLCSSGKFTLSSARQGVVDAL
jgi:SAM-dependent methyltransferase